jgi:hypothetical protein
MQGLSFEVEWAENRERGDFVSSQVEISTDLENWTSVTPAEISGNAQTVTRGMSIPGAASRRFVRLTFEMD